MHFIFLVIKHGHGRHFVLEVGVRPSVRVLLLKIDIVSELPQVLVKLRDVLVEAFVQLPRPDLLCATVDDQSSQVLPPLRRLIVGLRPVVSSGGLLGLPSLTGVKMRREDQIRIHVIVQARDVCILWHRTLIRSGYEVISTIFFRLSRMLHQLRRIDVVRRDHLSSHEINCRLGVSPHCRSVI